ncbi:N/A [soil metagenome]
MSASGPGTNGSEATVKTGERRFLLFRLGGDPFAMDSAPVQEILTLPPLTRVPRMPRWLMGLMNLRGEVVPIVDPRAALNCRGEIPAGTARVIVLDCSRGRVGFVADSTADVALVAEQDILPAEHAGRDFADSIDGLLMRGDQLVPVIDPESFFCGRSFRI